MGMTTIMLMYPIYVLWTFIPAYPHTFHYKQACNYLANISWSCLQPTQIPKFLELLGCSEARRTLILHVPILTWPSGQRRLWKTGSEVRAQLLPRGGPRPMAENLETAGHCSLQMTWSQTQPFSDSSLVILGHAGR